MLYTTGMSVAQGCRKFVEPLPLREKSSQVGVVSVAFLRVAGSDLWVRA